MNVNAKILFFYIHGKKGWLPNKETNEFYFACWSGHLSSYISKLPSKFSFINTRQESVIDIPIEKMIENVQVILYPERKSKFIGLWNWSLIKRIKKLSEGNNVIIHTFHAHNFTSYLFAIVFRNYPIVISNYGHTPPSKLINNRNSLFKNSKLLILDLFERFSYRFVDLYTPSGYFDRLFMKQKFPKMKIADFDHLGIDFSIFNSVGKQEARVQLGISKTSKVLIYVGHLYKLKGVDLILTIFNELKSSYSEIDLILIGAHESDELYNKANESGATVLMRMPQDQLFTFYSAADVYLMPNFDNELFVEFGGIGTAPLEALACITPVISTHLCHFPVEELDNVGIIPKDPSELKSSIISILSNPEKYSNCREITRKYYDRNIIAQKLLHEYDIIHEKYKN